MQDYGGRALEPVAANLRYNVVVNWLKGAVPLGFLTLDW